MWCHNSNLVADRLEKLVANLAAGDETGPLEATIKNLQREIDTKVSKACLSH